MVTSRSTSGFDDRTHRSTLPVPASTVVVPRGSVTYASALPAGTGFHPYLGVRSSSDDDMVRGNALGSYRKRSACGLDGAVSVSVPPAPRYQVVGTVEG